MSTTTDTATTPLIGDIEQFLRTIIAQMEPEPRPSGPGRPRILPALALWGGLLLCVLRGFSSQTALWRLLTFHGLWSYPRFAISDEAVYKRLEHGGLEALQGLFERVRQELAARLQPYALSKLLQEELARNFAEQYGMSIAVVRPGDIIDAPEQVNTDGKPVTSHSWRTIDRRDVASCLVAALEAQDIGYECFYAMASPGAHRATDVARTEQRLGWKPALVFDEDL